jgi:hypothetical protein
LSSQETDAPEPDNPQPRARPSGQPVNHTTTTTRTKPTGPEPTAPRKPNPKGQTNKEGEKFNPRLEITESQTRLRGYLARIFTQQPDRSFPLLPDRRGDMYESTSPHPHHTNQPHIPGVSHPPHHHKPQTNLENTLVGPDRHGRRRAEGGQLEPSPHARGRARGRGTSSSATSVRLGPMRDPRPGPFEGPHPTCSATRGTRNGPACLRCAGAGPFWMGPAIRRRCRRGSSFRDAARPCRRAPHGPRWWPSRLRP